MSSWLFCKGQPKLLDPWLGLTGLKLHLSSNYAISGSKKRVGVLGVLVSEEIGEGSQYGLGGPLWPVHLYSDWEGQ